MSPAATKEQEIQASIGDLLCPSCGDLSFRVIETRLNSDGRRRRRACRACNYRETVFELPEATYRDFKQARNQLNRVLRSLGIATPQEHVLVDSSFQPGAEEVEPLCYTCNYNTGTTCSLALAEFGTEASLDCLRYNRQ